MEAAAKPLPSEDNTPPVMKINLVLDLGLDDFMGVYYNF